MRQERTDRPLNKASANISYEIELVGAIDAEME